MSELGGETIDDPMHRVLGMVAERRGIDFRDYRPDTLRRRLESRMHVAGCSDLSAYQALLDARAEEIDRLVEALVVPVTEFFRDDWVFRELADRVLPALPAPEGILRAWVVGTASGEEAYTVAMVLAEAGGQRGTGFEVLASDVDERSLSTARKALYGDRALRPVPAHLRERHFRSDGSSWRVADSIRGRVRFAQHDLMGPKLAPREAVVAAFQLVFCRNVLMYFDAPLRAKAVDRLAAVLEPGGALIIGVPEALPERSRRLFEVHPAARPGSGIFRRIAG